MKVFIFAIGGTGARVLRSLTMLLASGVKINPEIELVPLIIDLDINNGDTFRAKNVINTYREIREKSYTRETTDGFFVTKLKNLSAYKAENYKGLIQDSFQLEFGNVDKTFFRFIEGNQLNLENSYLLESLFDTSPEPKTLEEPTNTELYLNLSKGFKGNPNIGSIVFNDLVNTNEYRYFCDICNEQDKIFIISSIFGGTGSAGFPQLVKNIRKNDKAPVKNSHLGALVVMPYFNIAGKKGSAIDSNNFNSKTKAALSYYSSELEGLINDTYYIGCPPTGDAYENNEGGTEQKNKAHMVELISAMSIIDFAQKDSDNQIGGNVEFARHGFNYYEYGVNNEKIDKTYCFSDFFSGTQENIFRHLIDFTYFSKFYTEDAMTNDFLKSAVAKSMDINTVVLKTDPFFGKLYNFINEEYLIWMKELADNKPSFLPFNFAEDYRALIHKKDVKLKASFIIDNMTALSRQFQHIDLKTEKFMKIAFEACKKAQKERFVDFPQTNSK